jgi:hypothetical protein
MNTTLSAEILVKLGDFSLAKSNLVTARNRLRRFCSSHGKDFKSAMGTSRQGLWYAACSRRVTRLGRELRTMVTSLTRYHEEDPLPEEVLQVRPASPVKELKAQSPLIDSLQQHYVDCGMKPFKMAEENWQSFQDYQRIRLEKSSPPQDLKGPNVVPPTRRGNWVPNPDYTPQVVGSPPVKPDEAPQAKPASASSSDLKGQISGTLLSVKDREFVSKFAKRTTVHLNRMESYSIRWNLFRDGNLPPRECDDLTIALYKSYADAVECMRRLSLRLYIPDPGSTESSVDSS